MAAMGSVTSKPSNTATSVSTDSTAKPAGKTNANFSELLTQVNNYSFLPESVQKSQSVTFETNYQRVSVQTTGNNVEVTIEKKAHSGVWGFIKDVFFEVTHKFGGKSSQARTEQLKSLLTEQLQKAGFPATVTKEKAIYSLLNNFDPKINRSEGTSDE